MNPQGLKLGSFLTFIWWGNTASLKPWARAPTAKSNVINIKRSFLKSSNILIVGIDDSKKTKVAIKMISKSLVAQIDEREGNQKLRTKL